MKYPNTRLRRTRLNNNIRDIVAQNNITQSDLVLPLFVHEAGNENIAIDTMPEIYRYSEKNILKKVESCLEKGIKYFALFPKINDEYKSNDPKICFDENNLINRTIKNIKTRFPETTLFTDVALDPYTLHGHDGIIDDNSYIINDKTIEFLTSQALSQAISGSDVVCPSDMMDGRILEIRKNLEKNNFHNTLIMSYSSKYASNLYNPFRDAVGSKDCIVDGDKFSYQMDYRNSNDCFNETFTDIAEGADILMVKPAMFYGDIIKNVSNSCNIPVFAYQTSGEYHMIKTAIDNNILSENLILESLISIKRSGANAVFSYFADKITISRL